MGNYLLALRAPPAQDEPERNHPLQYDWTLPSDDPLRDTSEVHADGSQSSGSSAKESGATKSSSGSFKSLTSESIQSGKALKSKEALTNKTQIAKTTMVKSSDPKNKTGKIVKSVENNTRIQVDPKRGNNINKQAALKASTNIHNVNDRTKK